MTILEIIGILAGILSASAYIPYIKDVLARKTQPERASWLIWAVLTSIAFFSQFAKGASSSLWLSGLETIGITIVLLLSLKFGIGGLTKRDLFALFAASVGLILWYFTHEPAIALYIIIGIDAIGTVITIQKAYTHPESETMSTWVLVCCAGILSMIAVGGLNIILLSYPFYIFAANGAIALAMILGTKNHKMRTYKN
ncbi:MAG TPA: hypothetical protein VN711_02540 [Candidatus Saccharimonadales bacterium]|nr:hypothetical protein [Candidatus Saccharimonadales bacterium]